MNAYKQFMDERKSKITPDKWIQGNKLITDNFKKSYKRFVDGAYKADPEMGLDSDPIFDAQDYPDKGFTIDSCDENNFVTLKGADWQTFKVVVKTLNTPVGWRVDGSGIINIPEDKRAKR